MASSFAVTSLFLLFSPGSFGGGASCAELTKAYNERLRAGKEIITAEFRTRSELNEPYVWKPPMISEVDMHAREVNGVMIPAHREIVKVRPGYWVRTDDAAKDR